MSLRVALHHQTVYRYDRLVTLSPQVIRLRPAPHCRTPVHSYSLRIEPQPHFINWQQDPQGNFQARVVFPEKVKLFSITVDLVAEMTVINPFAFFLEPEAMDFPFTYAPELAKELEPYLETLPDSPLLAAYAAAIDRTKRVTNDFLVELYQQLASDITYMIRMEPGVQTPEETLEKRSGSCRDSAWLLVQIMRHLGLAARFTSGYLIQLVADVKPLEGDGPAGATADFTDLHAWTEVYLPGAGWVGLDPTSGLLTGEGHLPLASTPDPSSAAPVTGGVDECETEFDFAMTVQRIREDPRVTKPYTEEQWQAIDALGEKVDRRLKADDVRLSMGGEPTFIAIDDPDGAEWNIAADGPTKRIYAERLMRRLHARFSPFGLLHYGQGKWYPGEQLPRWALGTFWRRDGQPVWHDQSLIATYGAPYQHTAADAQRLTREIARRLGVHDEHAMPGYEDTWYYLARERRLPVNVDPLKSNLKDPLERERLAKVFEQGLDQVIGYVLPVERAAEGWRSGAWPVRGGRLMLIPGDSPMGWRLPMDSLPWVKPEDYPFVRPNDPTIGTPPLPAANQLQRKVRERAADLSAGRFLAQGWGGQPMPPERPLAQQQSADWIIRTAVCVEPRAGRLHVFMPPSPHLDHYLEVVAAVEDAARTTGLPVMIEGYAPPHDARINVLKVTPDPGVIEVNVHPTTTWRDGVELTTALYEEARSCRLDSQKFMIDGRHVGTGGGNHITVGGATPADSPFLRRPDLLRSMVGFWNNHPSLSYLFSGMFIGPTSQAPRVDDARSDSIYELEVAFRQLNREGTTPPWLVDRLFRNLLVDVTGNTHRSEFSIDKLYAPDSSTGRLGLLELRGFEMPPHARMGCAQQLLVRGLISHFWKQPYQQQLVRWGTELHDRFLLPHFVDRDFADVLGDLARGGLAFDQAWFAPHLEFRFPLLGEVAHDHVALELRQAIEPWHVLGEDPGPGGTVRNVDSSLERVQIKAKGLVRPRHLITCNGRPVPLHPTGTNGEYVAGVRYRAWQPPACLHPTIKPHVPLVFDLVDTWSGRSLGGFTYHVAHPGGLSYESAPVNSFSAEARRGDRFQPFGHTPGKMTVVEEATAFEHPFTLDLRR